MATVKKRLTEMGPVRRLATSEGTVSEARGAMAQPVRMLSCNSLLFATGVVLLAAVGIAVACHDLEYFRTKQECEHQFENEIRRSYDEHHDGIRSREVACCALMRANQCIKNLHEAKRCDDVIHETLAHFSRKARNWNCESFDYTPCGSGASIASASILLLVALLAFVVTRS
uniref:Putative conserved plasma membrane protein n=1 Tax=Amblyomma tuberculatum TaxID=48802 RepID=A0A6M2E4R2_9ACAR